MAVNVSTRVKRVFTHCIGMAAQAFPFLVKFRDSTSDYEHMNMYVLFKGVNEDISQGHACFTMDLEPDTI